MSKCAFTDTDNHSEDILEIWHGREKPTYLCGYHEQSRGLNAALQQEMATVSSTMPRMQR